MATRHTALATWSSVTVVVHVRVTYPKAFGGDCWLHVLGGMLAGHSESGGEVVGNKTVSNTWSSTACNTNRLWTSTQVVLLSTVLLEGKTVLLPYRGSVHNTISRHPWWCTFNLAIRRNAAKQELTKRTTFIRVQEQRENNVFGKE